MIVTIRKARLKDVKAIVNLWKEFMIQHDNIVLKEDPKLKPYLIRKGKATEVFGKFAAKNIRSRNAIIHIAEVSYPY